MPASKPPLPLRPLPRLIFASRWLQLPLYLGLVNPTNQAAVLPVPTPTDMPGRTYSSAASAAACFICSRVMPITYPIPSADDRSGG